MRPTEKEIEKRAAEVMEFLSKVDPYTARHLILESGPLDLWRQKVRRDYKTNRNTEAKEHTKAHNFKSGSKVGAFIPANEYYPKRYIAGVITSIRRTKATIKGVDNVGGMGKYIVDIVRLLPA